MFNDEFKNRYTTLPFAIYKASSKYKQSTVISHQHKEMEVNVITQGYALFYVGSEVIKACEGDVVIIPPYELHRIEILSDTFAVYNCVCFDLSIVSDKDLTVGLENGTLNIFPIIKSDKSYTRQLASLVINAFESCKHAYVGWELEVIGNVSLFFAHLKRNNLIIKNSSTNANDFSKIIIDFITAKYKEPITSMTVSKELFLSNSYFCRLFKSTFGCCFSDYLLAFRLEKAKTLLEHTDTSISQIALNVGINDISYFSKNFKSYYGISPLKYRKSKISV